MERLHPEDAAIFRNLVKESIATKKASKPIIEYSCRMDR